MSDDSSDDEEGMSILDFCPSVSRPFPLSISAPALFSQALDHSRLQPAFKSHLRLTFSTGYMESGLDCLYWLMVARMFHMEKTAAVQAKLKQELSGVYVQLLLDHLESSDKAHMRYLPLVLSHAIILDLYEQFSASRKLLTEEFIVTLTREVYQCLLGVATSEVFVRQQLVSLFKGWAFHMDCFQK